MKTASTEPSLTFQWPAETGFPYVLFVCVAGSLLMHAGTFFLFQVVYPQRVTIPQPSPHVSLLTPSSPENIALLRWIEAEDPALIASDNAVPPPHLAEVRYQPSFSTPRTTPLGAPAEKNQEVRFPPAVDHLKATDKSPALIPLSTSLRTSTLIQFAGTLESRSLTQSPSLKAARLAVAPVGPTVLLIGVNGEGEIRYPILQQSSGDSALDDLAAVHLRRLRFASAESEMTWAHVVFTWGSDVYREAASNAESTAPISP